jgi:hypothetical protein
VTPAPHKGFRHALVYVDRRGEEFIDIRSGPRRYHSAVYEDDRFEKLIQQLARSQCARPAAA